MIEYIFNNIIFNISILQGHVTYRIFFYVSQWNLKEKNIPKKSYPKYSAGIQSNRTYTLLIIINYY